MNTKLLMTLSAFAMALSGIILLFLPSEILNYAGLDFKGLPSLTLQILGALYFAFGMVNWTAKANLIGGIYSKPVAIGNFSHFFTGALALDKAVFAHGFSPVLSVVAVIYSIFAILFGYIFFSSPVSKDKVAFNNNLRKVEG